METLYPWAVAMTELLLVALITLVPLGTARVTWYGVGDGFLGRHHAAYWHGKTPVGAPDVVTEDYLGIAAPKWIPFGTHLLLIRKDSGQEVVCVVVDRTGNGRGYDLWPATALALGFGPEYQFDVGVINADVYLIVGGD